MNTMVVAMDQNHAIGFKNSIPWKIPSDLKRFKEITKPGCLIMGRKTFESLPGILPNRPHIVVTRNSDYRKDGVTVVNSIQEAFDASKKMKKEAFVIGGSEIYKQAFSFCERVIATYVDGCVGNADTYFPDLDWNGWQIKEIIHPKPEQKDQFSYHIKILEKITLVT